MYINPSTYYYVSIIRLIFFFFINIVHVEREIVRLLFVTKLQSFYCQNHACPWRKSPEVGSRSVRKVERASVSERKHIKDGALLKEERKRKKQRGESKSLFFSPAELHAHSVYAH